MPKTETRLARWLRLHGETQTAFARRLSSIRGQCIPPPRVSEWCSGRVVPSPMSRHFIAAATYGGVPVGAWGR